MTTPNKDPFLQKTEQLVLDHISNEKFGVAELAEALNMSRSNLLRKIKKLTGLSASQYIRKIRLDEAKNYLKDHNLTISEIAYHVGFSNASYFIKCFREEFGVPPGEIRQQHTVAETTASINYEDDLGNVNETTSKWFQYKNPLIIFVSILIILFVGLYVNNFDATKEKTNAKKSIAVLPFKNLSTDSSNLYFVNGLMESSLVKLQKIEDLRVISRTSVEKYRTTKLNVSEIANELDVTYIVEGSGQRVNNTVLLNIQLIDTSTDTPIWTEQYNYELKDIFELQNLVAKKIALAIEANITPNEFKILDHKPTENVEAYDFYLKGYELSQIKTDKNLLEAITFYDKAINLDKEFSDAYGQKAIAYYFLDQFKTEKKFLDKLNENADKALLYNSKSDISLISKALYYITNNEFNLAIPHLEKALEYNPNSASVVLMLSDLYSRAVPNTAKLLKYALKGVQLNVEASDSIGKSFIYLHLSNALIQTGFIDEALINIEKSLNYNANNPYAPYLKNFIEYAKYENIEKTTDLMHNEWQKDTTRLDLLNEVAKLYYYQEDYTKALSFYKKYIKLKQQRQIDLYPQENLKIAVCFKELGFNNEALFYYNKYSTYCNNDSSIYKSASIAMKQVYDEKYDEAIANYKLFATKSNFQFWVIVFLEKDPLLKKLQQHPEYKSTMNTIREKFWQDHRLIKEMLKENQLL